MTKICADVLRDSHSYKSSTVHHSSRVKQSVIKSGLGRGEQRREEREREGKGKGKQ